MASCSFEYGSPTESYISLIPDIFRFDYCIMCFQLQIPIYGSKSFSEKLLPSGCAFISYIIPVPAWEILQQCVPPCYSKFHKLYILLTQSSHMHFSQTFVSSLDPELLQLGSLFILIAFSLTSLWFCSTYIFRSFLKLTMLTFLFNLMCSFWILFLSLSPISYLITYTLFTFFNIFSMLFCKYYIIRISFYLTHYYMDN